MTDSRSNRTLESQSDPHAADDSAALSEALSASEERFRAMFDNAAIGKGMASPDMRFLRVNRVYCEMFGYGEAELLSMSPADLTHPEDDGSAARAMDELLRGERTSMRVLKRYRHKAGHTVWGEQAVSLVRDASGAPLYFLAEVVDVTERRRAEEALRASEEQFRSAFENAGVGKAIASPTLRFLRVNRAYCEMLGYSEAELLTMSPADLGHPDDIAVGLALVEDLLAGRRSFGRAVGRHMHKDGSARWGELTLTLVRDASGAPSHFLGELVDLTDHKRAEELVRDRELKLAEAQRVAHVGSWEYDVAADRSEWSDELYRIFGLERSFQPSMQAAFERFHAEDRPRVEALVAHAIESGQPFDFEARFVHTDGSYRVLHSVGRAELDAAGRATRLYGVAQDITERRRAEEALRASEALFRAAFEHTAVAKAISSPDLRIVQVNRAACRMSGRSEEEMLSMTPVEMTHPDDRPKMRELIDRLRTGRATSGTLTLRFTHPERGIMWGEQTRTLVRDERGKPLFFISETVDVTEREQATQALRTNEELFRAAFEHTAIGKSVTGLDLRIRRINRAACVLLGRSEEELVGRTSLDITHPDDHVRNLELAQRLLAGEASSGNIEIRYLHKDGRVVWANLTRTLLRDERGVPAYFLTEILDETDRKLAEEGLRASEERFRHLYTQAPVMMTVIGPDGLVREVSNHWLSRMGYERGEVVGRAASEFATPDSLLRLTAEHQRSMLAGERVVRSMPMVAVHKDGSHVHVLTTSVIELDERHQFQGALTVGMDVTHIRRAEEAVRESEERYRALVEHAPEGILIVDGESGMFIDANAAATEVFGYTREEFLRMSPPQTAPERQPDGSLSTDFAKRQIDRARAGGAPSFEWTCRHKNGRDMVVLVRLALLPAQGRALIRSVVTDVTELRLLQEKARNDDRLAAIGVLAAGVAHEIGNPLLAMSMAVQSLERKSTDDYAQRKLALVREHIERISKIVRQMSDLARPRAALKGPCDLNRVVERALEIMRYDKRSREVELSFAPSPDVPLVDAVEDQIMQVCLNLGLNALDAVASNDERRGRSLSIHTTLVERDGRAFARAVFVDNGPGVPEAARQRIFQPFFTTKAPGKGTGLGLSVSYRIIEEHAGRLAFECPPPRGAANASAGGRAPATSAEDSISPPSHTAPQASPSSASAAPLTPHASGTAFFFELPLPERAAARDNAFAPERS